MLPITYAAMRNGLLRFASNRSQTLNRKRPPGQSTRTGFPKTLDLVGKEHGAELAQDHIELGGGKRQVEGMRVDSSTGR